jgi:hypothetical protein
VGESAAVGTAEGEQQPCAWKRQRECGSRGVQPAGEQQPCAWKRRGRKRLWSRGERPDLDLEGGLVFGEGGEERQD